MMGVTKVDAQLLSKVNIPKSDTQKGDQPKMDTSKEGHPNSDTTCIDQGNSVKKVVHPSLHPKERKGGVKRERPTYPCPLPGCPFLAKDIRSHMSKVLKILNFGTRNDYLKLVVPFGRKQDKDVSKVDRQSKDVLLLSKINRKDASLLSKVERKDASLLSRVDRTDASLLSKIERKNASFLSNVERKDASFLSKGDTQNKDAALLSKTSTKKKDMSKSSLQQKSNGNSTEADMVLKQLITDLELSDDDKSDSEARETEMREGVETHTKNDMGDESGTGSEDEES